MLGVLWNRLPLTISAWVIVGGYSVVTFVARKIKTDYWRTKISIGSRDAGLLKLPQDIIIEIMVHVISQSTDEELLEVSLTCKQFYKQISNSSSWLKERLQHYYDNIPHTNASTSFVQSPAWHRQYETDLLGADKVFSPKLAYYFIVGRSDPPKYRYRTRIAISPNLSAHRDKKLYLPWLDHDLAALPGTLWRLIKTILISPEWVYSLLIAKEDKIRGMKLDGVNTRRIFKVFNWLSHANGLIRTGQILLSYLPFLDSFLYQYRGSFSNLVAAKSIPGMLSLIWNAPPMPFIACLRISLNLIPSMIETSYSMSYAVLIRMACMALLYATSFRMKDFVKPLGIAIASFLIGPFFLKPKLRPFSPVVSLLGASACVLSVFHYNPVTSAFFFVLYLVWSGNRGHNERTKRRSELNRVILLLSLPIVLSNCIEY